MTNSTLARPRVRVAAVLLVLAVGVAGVLVWRLGKDPVAPYDDARSTGLLTLCKHGERVSGGKARRAAVRRRRAGLHGAARGQRPGGRGGDAVRLPTA
ncbi:hypothetical protein G5V59_06165 [Nocardioides sp. W3-2-3]|uniref:hypothetical protein n=1 Tax=Nocardioides convexus TaxID=2712224 RepID=UPI0024189E00|nr:hypothetical protein [Nocardioides convexus]NGZ99962.1 hypothetical protein [Nocardioides convexus]